MYTSHLMAEMYFWISYAMLYVNAHLFMTVNEKLHLEWKKDEEDDKKSLLTLLVCLD